MRQRTTVVLFCLFMLGLGVMWWADYANIPTREERARILDRLLPDLIDTATADVRRIEVSRGTGKDRIVVERKGEGPWQMREPVDAAADATLVETLVQNLKNLRKSSDAGTIVADPAAYGLAPPAAILKIFVKGQDEPIATLDLGKTNKERGYVRPGGGPGIEVVDTRFLEAVTLDPVRWRDLALFRIPSFQIGSVAIHESKPGRDLTIERGERRWRIVKPIKAPADDDKVEGLVAELSALQVADKAAGFVRDDVRDLAPFGLDDPTMTIALTPASGNGPAQVVALGNAVPGKKDQVYALRGDQDDVVRVDVKRLREGLPGLNGLRSPSVLDFTPQRVDRLRIDARGKVFDLARRPQGWAILGPVADPADVRSVQSLLTALANLKAAEFLEPARVADPRLDAPTFRIRGWQPARADTTAIGLPSTSAGAPTEEPRFDLTLGRHDALRKSVFGRVAGDTTILVLPDSVLDPLPRNDFAFRDRTILDLKPTDFARIRVERRQSSVTVEAPGSGRETLHWKMIEPVEAAADDAAVTALAVTLSHLIAETWESDRVGDGKAFGLDAPWLRVTWTLQAAPTPAAKAQPAVKGTLRVGKTKGSSSVFYANIEGEPLVFGLNPGVVQAIEAELRNTAVMPFPPERAARVVLRWPSRTLSLVKTAGGAGPFSGWKPSPGSDPSGFDLSRVGAMVAALAELKTPRFLQYAGPFSEGFGLTPPRVTLSIGVVGQAGERTLRVGHRISPDAFAATTAGGDDGPVFVLPVNPAWTDLLNTPARPGDLPDDVFAPAPPAAKPPG